MTKATKQQQAIEEPKTILTKDYRWSNYAFVIDLISFSTLIAVVCTLMAMHRATDSAINFGYWVIILVGCILFALAVLFSFLDARRGNPKERLFGSRIFCLPLFGIAVLIAIAIFWGKPVQNSVVYGVICGGFAGYLAGGLAFANFIIHIKDIVYRIIFGGWIGVFLGVIIGGVFGGVFDPIGGQVFGGIFFGFWGGVASGAIATVLLYLFKEKRQFTAFFTGMLLYDIRKDITMDLEDYFKTVAEDEEEAGAPTELNLNECRFFETREEKKRTKIVEILLFIIFLINPWEERDENYRLQVFSDLVDYSIKRLGYTREENILRVS